MPSSRRSTRTTIGSNSSERQSLLAIYQQTEDMPMPSSSEQQRLVVETEGVDDSGATGSGRATIGHEPTPTMSSYQTARPSLTRNPARDQWEENYDSADDTAASATTFALATTIASASLFALAISALVVLFPTESSLRPSSSGSPPASTSSTFTTYLLGSTGMAPPYVTRGIPSSLALDKKTFNSDPSPFSDLTPAELGFHPHARPSSSRPGTVFGSWRHDPQTTTTVSSSTLRVGLKSSAGEGAAMPTNAWYQNLLLGSVNEGHLTPNHRAYTVPYILDMVGPVPGIRIQFPHILSSDTIIQLSAVERHGLTLGTLNDGKVEDVYCVDEDSPPRQLSLGLKWTKKGGEEDVSPTMRTQIIRGMPYVTMSYSGGVTPVVASQVPLTFLSIDGRDVGSDRKFWNGLKDKKGEHSKVTSTSFHVEKVVTLTFGESDFTWLVFFSRPTKVAFFHDEDFGKAEPLPPGVVDFSTNSAFELRVLDAEESPIMVRAALQNNCTTGGNSLFCVGGEPREQAGLDALLRNHADTVPHNPRIRYDFPSEVNEGKASAHASIIFDWGAFSMSSGKAEARPSRDLLMYALPHHIDSIDRVVGENVAETGYCSEGLHGKACLIRGSEWIMEEDLDGPPSFVARRPPNHKIIPDLAEAVSKDIHFRLPDYYMRGAGDTYFSGKQLAKLARIIVIASELRGLAATPDDNSYDLDDSSERELRRIVEASKSVVLPSDEVIASALSRLRSGVEVWLNGTAQAKFIYDEGWGGMINCGCLFNEKTERCDNDYPNCPTFTDPGLNFGNGFYNDHHFHYGYFIYAAAVVANYDLAWGRKHFQEVLLLIRDIANPSIHDKNFPAFRHKDWFLGSSWASGIATLGGAPYLNGRNQESSSEAIHAYEAIALYGSVMMHAWGDGTAEDSALNGFGLTARRISLMGRLLSATEVRSAQRYWHVLHGEQATKSIYPKNYKPSVVGMMWQTMCQFQTWFGSSPFLAYGIQLMPLTSIAERRDSVEWLQQMYIPFAASCESDQMCEDQGWSVLQYAVLSAVGHRDLAAEKAKALPGAVFDSAGGNGHSKSNTLWYIATRPDVDEPLRLEHVEKHKKGEPTEPKAKHVTCECEETCTVNQLNADAGGYTCLERIGWLMSAFGKSEVAACRQVGGSEWTNECASCDPDRCAPPPPSRPKSAHETELDETCPPCSSEVCQSESNRCPRSLLAPFVCLSGSNVGGCSQTPWGTSWCTQCCRLTEKCFN